MYSLKFDCCGKVSGVSVPMDTSVTCEISKDSFADELGKVIYSLEQMGYPINTHDVYESIINSEVIAAVGYKFKVVATIETTECKIKLSMKTA